MFAVNHDIILEYSLLCFRSVYAGDGSHPFGCSKLALWKSIFTAFRSAPLQALKLLWTILLFFRASWKFLKADETVKSGITLNEFARKAKLTPEMIRSYLLPLASVLRPCGSDSVLELDAYTILRAMADNYLLSFSSVTWVAFSGQVGTYQCVLHA